MKAKLVISNVSTKEGEFEKIVPPELEILTIGRHPSSYVYLTSAHISKEHALIIREYDVFHLIDKSSNGTMLNRVRLEREKRYQLKSGDIILAGEFQIVFVIEQDQPRAQATAAAGATELIAPRQQPAAPVRNLDPYAKDPLDPVESDPGATLASFAPTSFEDIIRGLDPGEESSYLVFVGGARDGQRIELRGSTSEIFVGRAATCQVQIQHPTIGQQHAKIRMDWAGITIYDLNSQSGVFINGVRINSSRKLHNGDEISFGVPVSMGGVKLILYDRNSISGDNWVGLPPPITVKNNEKEEEKSVPPAPAASTPAAPAPATPPVSAAAKTAAPAAETDEDEEDSAPKPFNPANLLDLNQVIYSGVTVKDALFIGLLIVVAILFIAIALSFL